MAITQISRKEFDVYGPARQPGISLLATEISWFADDERNVIGAILFDKSDKDWNYVILGPDETNTFRWIAGDSSFETQEIAEATLRENMSRIESTGQFEEAIYKPEDVEPPSENSQILFKDINEELKGYFAKHPEKLYDLTPRTFEELVASIMEDFGFTVELTQATRDGGRDIIAYIRSAIGNYLTLVECKKYAQDNKVGVGIVRKVLGVHHLRKANKSLIVTTSFFTRDAKEEARDVEHALELKDYNNIKQWLLERPTTVQ